MVSQRSLQHLARSEMMHTYVAQDLVNRLIPPRVATPGIWTLLQATIAKTTRQVPRVRMHRQQLHRTLTRHPGHVFWDKWLSLHASSEKTNQQLRQLQVPRNRQSHIHTLHHMPSPTSMFIPWAACHSVQVDQTIRQGLLLLRATQSIQVFKSKSPPFPLRLTVQ